MKNLMMTTIKKSMERSRTRIVLSLLHKVLKMKHALI